MFLDIGLGVLLLLFVAFGFWKGFMCGIIGFVSSALSLIAAIFSAKPVANLMDRWFSLSDKLGDAILDVLGRPLNILICAIVVYFIVRLFFFGITRMIKKIKEEHDVINSIDKFLGIGLGFAKFLMFVCVVFIVVALLNEMPIIDRTANWLFNGSKVGTWLYEDIFVKLIWERFNLKEVLAFWSN